MMIILTIFHLNAPVDGRPEQPAPRNTAVKLLQLSDIFLLNVSQLQRMTDINP